MQIYSQTYNAPIQHIIVPEQFRQGNFKVTFEPIAELTSPKVKNMPNPLLAGVGIMHDDLIAPTTDIDDWELD